MEKQYICYQGKDGKPAFREATTEELAAMQPIQLVTWHVASRPIRVIITSDVMREWLTKKRNHEDVLALTGQSVFPELVAVVGIVQSISNEFIRYENECLYVYLETLEDIHRAIVEGNGGVIEVK